MNGKLASKYKVGHVLMGSDGELYNVILTKNNIKRWVRKFGDSDSKVEKKLNKKSESEEIKKPLIKKKKLFKKKLLKKML